MQATVWSLVLGALLILTALTGTVLQRLPLSPAVLYLAIGYGLGPMGAGLIRLDLVKDALLLERLAEIAVLVSLFTVGLKLRVPLGARQWRLPLQLAIVSMMITVAAMACIGTVALELPLGAAIALAAILAPTDPVLASEIQLRDPADKDRLRFSLTGEGGLNDGVALPFVLLGLGLIGGLEGVAYALDWFARDVVSSTIIGLGSGWLCGYAIGCLVVHLRREYREALGLDEFLVLGTIAFSYGLAHLFLANGFLAVFAAGLALRTVERQASSALAPDAVLGQIQSGQEDVTATHARTAPAHMTESLLGFNQQLERIAEFAVVLAVGGMLSTVSWRWEAIWLALALFLLVRPMAVSLGTIGSQMSRSQWRLTSWFGIRGIGSVYYLVYALGHGLSQGNAERFASLVLPVVALSIVLHGVSATPLMRWYQRKRGASGT
jgi:sodium/hydrogen antiporter